MLTEDRKGLVQEMSALTGQLPSQESRFTCAMEESFDKTVIPVIHPAIGQL